MSLYKRKGGETYYIDVRHNGRRVRRSTKTSDRAQAKRQHDEIAARLHRERTWGHTLYEALLAWMDARPRAEPEINRLKLIRRLYADRALADVTPESVETTFGPGRGPATYNRLMAIIRAALRIAKQRGWIDAVPALVQKHEAPAEARALTAEEWGRLREELPEHLRDMAEFAIATGLRFANVSMLEWERVDLDRALAWIPGPQAKARKAIGVPLPPAALRLLRGREQGYPWVFTYQGRPVWRISTAWRKACARAGLPGLRFHDLRHTWASWHAMNGTPLDVLQQLGAWRTRSMVERYSHLTPGYVAGYAANAAPKVRKRPRRGDSFA